MSFDNNSLEKLRFDQFGFENVLLYKTNDPYENMAEGVAYVPA